MEIETLQSGDLLKNHNAILDNMENEDDWEGGDNSAKLFERSRIKALAGRNVHNMHAYMSAYLSYLYQQILLH